MMKSRLILLAMVVVALAAGACSSPHVPPPTQPAPQRPAAAPASATATTTLPRTYTREESSRMTYCVGLSDTARRVATEKLKGTPIARVKQLYEGKPNARLNLATVDKVFKEPVTTAWDYTVAFFEECAREMAGVPRERVRFASYCLQNQLIAEVAHRYKTAGKPREQAVAHFAQFKSETPRLIVDRVYGSPKESSAIRMEIWNGCMAEFTPP